MDKHTPTPWTYVSSVPAEGYECFWIKAQPSPVMRGFTKEIGAVNGPINDETEANAALIVRAVNSHASLLSTIKELMEALERVVEVYRRDNPMRTADVHYRDCKCLRCQIDHAAAAHDTALSRAKSLMEQKP